jgi:RNase P/RNase MRP subunit p30
MSQIIIHESNFEKARKAIKNAKSPIIFETQEDELNRQVLEKEKIDVLLLNQKNRKDFQKQRNSGFNQVLAKLCKKNEVSLGINLDEIINSNKIEKAQILARVKQNIELCKKNKLKMTFIGKQKDTYDLISLGLVLGIPTSITKTF